MQHYQRIRDLREDHDLTQEELCRQLYMHKTTYTNYEQGKHTVPLDFAVTLAEFYDVSLDYIAGRTIFQHGAAKPALTKEETTLIGQFRQLSERHKGRVQQLMLELLDGQNNE